MNDEEIQKALRPLRDAPRIPTDRREAAFERIRTEWKAGLAEQQPATTRTPARRWMFATAARILVRFVCGTLTATKRFYQMISAI